MLGAVCGRLLVVLTKDLVTKAAVAKPWSPEKFCSPEPLVCSVDDRTQWQSRIWHGQRNQCYWYFSWVEFQGV